MIYLLTEGKDENKILRKKLAIANLLFDTTEYSQMSTLINKIPNVV